MTATEFTLFAPYNEAACLQGDFSDWQDVPMEKDDKGFFRASVELKDGEYNYVFRVKSKSWFLEENEWVTVVDPYATRVNDTAEPSGVVLIKDGQRIVDEYDWQHDDTPLPADHELVIYEMHIGDFSGGEDDPLERGQYKHVTEKLDYLSDLGVNALELMPVEEYPGDHSWGYNPRYFFAAESSYGPSRDLKQLIDTCHARGIRVIKDGVYNHSDASSPLTQIDHDYWFHHEPQDKDNNWGPEFNYEKYDEALETFPARRYIGDVIKFWTNEYHIDGIRFDAAKQINNYDFMHWIVQEAKETAGEKPFYMIAEHIPETPEITGEDGPMDACWHESFYHSMQQHLVKGERDFEQLKRVLDGKRAGFLGVTNLVNYLSNHDHNHLFADFGNEGILEDAAFKRARTGAALLMTAVGVPMLWMGQEFGECTPKRTEVNKLNWTLLKNDANKTLYDTYKGLIQLRKTNSALHGTDIDFFHEDTENGVMAYVRWNGEGSRVVTIVNLSGHYLKDYTLTQFPADGTWHEWLADYDVEAHDGSLSIDLPEFDARVFVK